jgi:hypothetical protein
VTKPVAVASGRPCRDDNALVVVLVVPVVPGMGVPPEVRIDEHRQELAALHQLGIAAGLVGLHVEQEPAAAQDAAGIDDPRRLLVLGEEGRIGGGCVVEELRVMVRDLDELAGADIRPACSTGWPRRVLVPT